MKRLKKFRFTFYHKIAFALIIIGFLPIALIVSFMENTMIASYKESLQYQYEQAAGYISNNIESNLDSFNTISKLPYYYNLAGDDTVLGNAYSFDNFRNVIYGDIYDPESMEEDREQDMERFLKYIQTVNSNIMAVHFLGIDEKGNELAFHYSDYNTYFKDEDFFEKTVGYEEWDKKSTDMIIIPTHSTKYFNRFDKNVITVARNFFDLRGQVGNLPYIGTLFIDIDIRTFDSLFWSLGNQDSEAVFFLTDAEGNCIYSTDSQYILANVGDYFKTALSNKDKMVIQNDIEDYGLKVTAIRETKSVYGEMINATKTLYIVLFISALAIIIASMISAGRLTKPIYEIIDQMKEVEKGNFDINLKVKSDYEIEILAERVNKTSQALKQYINQSYVAKIKQNEAELTALKSQIYPHFLYNTLEVIRMTALEDGNKAVPDMIESLSEQIHYLIGPMQDQVTLDDELEIIKKYIYLLNCRINGKVQLQICGKNQKNILIPKLILQPVVENAYVHGIKPKTGNGTILISFEENTDVLEINIMDNGIGMSEEEIKKIYELMASDAPGIKNETNWQSIGLKNVRDRIKYQYGDKYGIEITSTLGIGTNTKLTLPLMYKKECDE